MYPTTILVPTYTFYDNGNKGIKLIDLIRGCPSNP